MLDTCRLCEQIEVETSLASGFTICLECEELTEGDTPEEDYDTEEL
jgi:hypothetical protein